MSGDYETYEWHETPYGEFRVEKKRFGTWTSYGKDGQALITGLTKEVVVNVILCLFSFCHYCICHGLVPLIMY